MTPTQLFRAALQLERTRQSFATLDRHNPLDTERALRLLRRNVRDADSRNECDERTRDSAANILLTYYRDRRTQGATQLTE